MIFKNEIKNAKLYLPNGTAVDFANPTAIGGRSSVCVPIDFDECIDERLDTAKVTLSEIRANDYPSIDLSKKFEPRSRFEISFYNTNEKIDMIVAHDDVRMVRKDGLKKYTHKLQLVETVKHAEFDDVDTLTFQNPRERKYDYDSFADWIFKRIENTIFFPIDNGNGWIPPEIKSAISENSITFSDNLNLFNVGIQNRKNNIDSLVLKLKTPTGTETEVYSVDKPSWSASGYTATDVTLQNLTNGEYTLTWVLKYRKYDQRGNETKWVVAKFATISVSTDGQKIDKPYSLADVIRRLLSVTPLRKKSEADKYSFDPEQLAEFETIESAEFAFDGNTLFEAMLQIAQYRGMFPAMRILQNGEKQFYFKKMDNGVRLSSSDLPEPIEEISVSDINDYCTYIDGAVQNLVGVASSAVGSISEPYKGGWKSPRSGGGSEISQDTAVIESAFKKYLQVGLEEGFLQKSQTERQSIALDEYVYEDGEYNALSDTSATYPNSKAYALRWAQGKEGISELAHRIKSSSALVEAFTNPALANIVSKKANVSTSSAIVQYLKNLIDIGDGNSFADLVFRDTYIPMIDARIRQFKNYYGDFHFDGGKKRNQTATLVDSEMLGEHLKNLVCKLGNSTKQTTYIFGNIDEVPKCGTQIDGLTVYERALSITENRVVATLYLVKHSELSQFIGVRNAWKDSDVSDKYAERNIAFDEFVLITADQTKHPDVGNSFTEFGLRNLLAGQTYDAESHPLTCVRAKTYRAENEQISDCILPVVSLPVGNSLVFFWKYKNNYSAGDMSTEAPSGAVSLLSGTKYNRAMKAVRYADSFGRFKTLDFDLMEHAQIPSESTMTTDDGEVIDGSTSVLNEEAIAKAIGYNLPNYSANVETEVECTAFSVNDLLIDKNSAESISVTASIHFYRDNPEIIIGSGLTNCSPLIGARQNIGGVSVDFLTVYGVKRKLSEFERTVTVYDNDDFEPIIPTQISFNIVSSATENRYLEITIPEAVKNYEAWAWLVPTSSWDGHSPMAERTMQICIGCNNTNIRRLRMVPKRKHD